MNPGATPRGATAARAPFSYLVIEHEPSRERGEHDEQYVQVDEKTRRVAGATAATHRGLNCLAAEDDERDPERKREQRQQKLARAHPHDHLREQASEHGHPHGGEEARGNDLERNGYAEEQRE